MLAHDTEARTNSKYTDKNLHQRKSQYSFVYMQEKTSKI